MRRHAVMALSIALLAMTVAPSTVNAHPLHSTITELTEDRAHGIVRATIRVFAADFGVAAARRSKHADALAYIVATFALTDRSGRALPLRACGTRRTGDLLWICVEASSSQGLAGLSVHNGMLSDLFDDQVNVVQGTIGGTRRSLLFTKGDRAKPLG